MINRTYEVGTAQDSGRPTITVHTAELAMPFSVWRDVGRLASISYSPSREIMIFEFVVPEHLEKAENILKGGMFERKAV